MDNQPGLPDDEVAGAWQHSPTPPPPLTAEQRPSPLGKVLVTVLVFGLFILGGNLLASSSSLGRVRYGLPSTAGTVTQCLRETDGQRACAVDYSLYGKGYSFPTQPASTIAEGSTITVYYNPAVPSDAVGGDTYNGGVGNPWSWVGAGICFFLIVAVLALYAGRRRVT